MTIVHNYNNAGGGEHLQIIDTFKDKAFYENLEDCVSPKIISILNDKFNFPQAEAPYESREVEGKVKIISWFDPLILKLRANPIPQPYEGDIVLRKDPKFNLQDHYPAHVFLPLINKLYSDQKHLLIDDVCCGIGRTEVYLKHLGFNYFHMVDNFSQITKLALTTFMEEAGITYQLNDPNVKPIITYISGFTTFPKEIVDSVELFCHYSNPGLILSLPDILLDKGFILFCRDVDNLLWSWCKESKLEEFKDKIKPFVV